MKTHEVMTWKGKKSGDLQKSAYDVVQAAELETAPSPNRQPIARMM